jgi:hypothetical protein
VTLTSYTSATGVAVFATPLNHYHWGQSTSTASSYNGVDIRGEVLLLSRNIKIAGEDIEAWGGQIVTSDTIEGDLTMRFGQLFMDNVEIYNCSQLNTAKAAIRFEVASGKYSSLTNSVLHNGLSWGMFVERSANIHISNNVFFSFKPLGVVMESVRNITFENNFVGHIYERDTGTMSGQMWADRRGGVVVCAMFKAKCYDLHIKNNIVAGTAYAGFVVPASDCDTPGDKFFNNIVHSIAGYKGGMGAVVYPDKSIPAH